MGLQDRLLQDMKAAMKSGDKILLETIRGVRAAVTNAGIASGREPTDDDIVEVLTREAKRRRESIDLYRKGGREDLVQQESRELEIVLQYLPKPLSSEELNDIVDQAINDTGADSMRQMGQVMGHVMPLIKGRADGKAVQELVKQKLS